MEGAKYHRDGGNLPVAVKEFIYYFHEMIEKKNKGEILRLYSETFRQLSQEHYAQTRWPSAESISSLVQGDTLFLTLYSELCFRHIYANLQPEFEERFDSWQNYCNLFDYIIDSEVVLDLPIPTNWLWDIIDEYIYQFQSFCQFRSKLKQRNEGEIELLKLNPELWKSSVVLETLNRLVEKSHIQETLQEKLTPDCEGYAFAVNELDSFLGYFSLVGLLRLNCLLGDYHSALMAVDNIELTRKTNFNKIIGCFVTIYYYLAFCYMMVRRYYDAARLFSNILVFLSRSKFFINKLYQAQDISKKGDQMLNLLAMCLVLAPQRVDEQVHQNIKEKLGEKLFRLQKGELSVFEELFGYSCPKFMSPVGPDYNAPTLQNQHQRPFQAQLKLFKEEIEQQTPIPALRSYLKLYTSIEAPKLADYLECDEASLKEQLMLYKLKSHSLTRASEKEDGDGELVSTADVQFYVEDKMIVINDEKPPRRYGDYFLRNLLRLDEMNI